MTDLQNLYDEYAVPFEQVQENLRKVFDEYGVTKRMQADWLETSDFYSALMDKKTGQLSERGRETMERWKKNFGDKHGEMCFEMYMID